MERRCIGFLSMNKELLIEKYGTPHEALAVAPLEKLGWSVDLFVNWHDLKNHMDTDPTILDRYAALVIRTTWDYQDDPDTFKRFLFDIEARATTVPHSPRLLNSAAAVSWNMNKTYLKELSDLGVPTIPTVWQREDEKVDVAAYIERAFEEFPLTREIVVKPSISAGGFHTYLLYLDDDGTYRMKRELADACFQESHDATDDGYLSPLATKAWLNRVFGCEDASTRRTRGVLMVQPFMSTIVTEGEYSIFCFQGEFSHAVRKIPKQNEFRVQSTYGGSVELIESLEQCPKGVSTSLELLKQVCPHVSNSLYARIDLVRAHAEESTFFVIEVEVIEPCLYFADAPGSAQRFAEALHRVLLA